MLSAHADSDEIMAWLNHFEAAPRTTFISHGEPDASDALRHRIEEEIGWTCVVPDYKDQQSLA
jgi:metallo-beta-lactamase family protein